MGTLRLAKFPITRKELNGDFDWIVLKRSGAGWTEPLALRALGLRDSIADMTTAKESRAQVVKLYEGRGKRER
jgi:hypothetical protein